MAQQIVKTTTRTKKNRDPNRPRRVLVRNKLVQNKRPIDLTKVAARRRLKVKR